MDVRYFDFELPGALIALRPAEPRDAARLLVVQADGRIEHGSIRHLPRFLRRGDALVLNDTKVIQARLRGVREGRRGGVQAKIELLLHRRLAPDRFSALARPARKLAVGDNLKLGGSIQARVAGRGEAGEVELAFEAAGTALDALIAAKGETPLPPYIAGRRRADLRDLSDYQTIYAREEGSVAAPTAGLHFTAELFTALAEAGITRETVTLHVGAGTFLPVTADDTNQHKMHSEYAELPAATAERLNAVRAQGGRIATVGTTSLRTLESAAAPDGALGAFAGETDIFITPGYRFRTAEILLTNFHLPRSTLFMLVCAFAGTETMQRAYREAIRERYRFYSYGDACLLLGPRG